MHCSFVFPGTLLAIRSHLSVLPLGNWVREDSRAFCCAWDQTSSGLGTVVSDCTEGWSWLEFSVSVVSTVSVTAYFPPLVLTWNKQGVYLLYFVQGR